MTRKALACLLAFGFTALARDEPKIVVNLDGFRYPPIATGTGIEGNVVFQVSAAGRELVSSANPLLTSAAERNVEAWTLPPGSCLVTYRFKMLNENRCEKPHLPNPAPRYVVTTGSETRIDVFVDGYRRCSVN